MVAKQARARVEDVPGDNGARLAIFDALWEATQDRGETAGLTQAEVQDRIIGRLRVLVPQELHNLGEDKYVADKLRVAVEAGIARWTDEGEPRLTLGESSPLVRYPDGTVRPYTPGLEAARERLDVDESRLRRAGFAVRQIVKSPANKRKSESYRRLVASIREHGFVGQLIESQTEGIIDGIARQAAAAEVGITLKPQQTHRLPRRRDTLLQNALLVLDLNADRLSEEDVETVHEAISARAQRPWLAIESDLELTREWRLTEPRKYDAILEVELLAFGPGREPKVQVTVDRTRLMLRSAMTEAGIREYRRDDLKPYVAMEEARTQFSGKKAIFVDIDDAIDGIAKMQRARTRAGHKVDTGWDDIRDWLIATFRPAGDGNGSAP